MYYVYIYTAILFKAFHALFITIKACASCYVYRGKQARYRSKTTRYCYYNKETIVFLLNFKNQLKRFQKVFQNPRTSKPLLSMCLMTI